MAKMVLRGTNFSCSLIVLAMLSTTFSIFNATRHLPPRNSLPAWAVGQKTWPQITLLCIACVSLAMSIAIFYAYWRGGHRRAEKAAVYYTVFAVGFFAFSTVMWAIGAAVLHGSKANGHGQDMWGWACNDNKRRTLFQEDVHYALVCRLQVSFVRVMFSQTVVNLTHHRTGLSSAVLSKSSSKSSPLPSMESYSIDSIRNAGSTSQWTFATAPGQISTLPNYVPNPRRIPRASSLAKPLSRPPSHLTSTTILSTQPRMGNTTTLIRYSMLKNISLSHSLNPSRCNRRPSGSSTPPRKSGKKASSQRLFRTSMFQLRRESRPMRLCQFRALTSVRWRAHHTSHRA